MKELSLHILDIVQNSIQAGASMVSIDIIESIDKNSYSIQIEDNGKGMNDFEINQVLDPFYTTKHKKTGLGIPLLQQHAIMANGSLQIKSKEGSGTIIKAVFQLNHIDRQPLGKIDKTLASIIRSNPSMDFVYTHQVNSEVFKLDTREIKTELDGVPINSPEVLKFLEEMIRENLYTMCANLE